MPDGCHETHPERRKRCDFASDAAQEAVKSTFAILGVDVEDPQQVEEFRKSLRFGDSMRRAADKGWIAVIVCLAGMTVAALMSGLKVKIGG